MSDFGPRGDLGRVKPRPYRQGGYDRERRLQMTIGAGAAIMLLVGIGIGFAIGRATAPKPAPTPAPVAIIEATPTASDIASGFDETSGTADLGLSDETSTTSDTVAADTEPPPRPRQTSPANGAVLNASRVTLRWTKVEDDSGNAVTYAFEIQDRLPGGGYGNTQVIKNLKSTSYSARVKAVRRRWRVWSVDDSGNASAKSPWRSYIHKYVAPKKSTDSSSTATSGTTD